MPRLIMNPDGGAAVEPSSPAARGESAASRAIVVDLADKERKRRMAGETGTRKEWEKRSAEWAKKAQ